MRFKNEILLNFFFIASVCCGITASTVKITEAAEKFSLFDRRVTYDIYFGNSEDYTTVIRDVEIMRVEEIAGRSFLVIKSHGFRLQDVDGFILLDAVTAILPNSEFNVQTMQKEHINK
ncbi:MAG: hypothetical protein A2Y04_04880 [Omnitrophica WOR_2 bacterium GWC2_45_7]|nr:MAG: hypothetical protein A2Y04_04880 [Omnitrophica WOR_2 bacterium GWC2_45_7]